jgi:hypothetical protein
MLYYRHFLEKVLLLLHLQAKKKSETRRTLRADSIGV